MIVVNDLQISYKPEFSNNDIKSIVIGQNVQSIEIGAFFKCRNLQNIYFLSDELIQIKSNAFYRCLGLQHIELPNSIIQIDEECFHRCYNLKSIKLPEKLKTIKFLAFDHCKSLEEIYIPKNVEKIDFGAFQYCKNLKNVYMHKKTFDNIKNEIDKIFFNSKKVKICLKADEFKSA